MSLNKITSEFLKELTSKNYVNRVYFRHIKFHEIYLLAFCVLQTKCAKIDKNELEVLVIQLTNHKYTWNTDTKISTEMLRLKRIWGCRLFPNQANMILLY